MSQAICLLVGISLGGLIGVTMMCLVQVNRNHKIRKDEFENEKEKHSEDC